jgi:hypothetical protein
VAIVRQHTICQFVMSCRVVGLEAEIAMIAAVTAAIGAPAGEVAGLLVETDANLLVRDLFTRCGFARFGETFVLAGTTVPMPPHIRLTAWPAEPVIAISPPEWPASGDGAPGNPWRKLRQFTQVVLNRGHA